LRRLLPLSAALAALVTATTAAASFRPIRRDFGEVTIPRVRAGTITIPAAQHTGLVSVIVRLAAPPLAAWNADRALSSASRSHRLDVSTATSQAYLARLSTLQRAAVAQLHAAIPQARVDERYRIVLDGFAVRVPAKKLPALARLGFVTRIYPSYTYSTTMDRGPAVIHADALEGATGDVGAGVKIAVVDTGVDWKSPFLDPTGFSYPPGFPKGDKTRTSAKVIVARDFPVPGSDKAGKLAFDPTEPHGTHVSGIAAGDAGTTAPQGRDHPLTPNLSGVAPRAYIGNYRVFNIPTPIGHLAGTPQIVAAFESAVADGMDVINFSGGGPQTDPVNDAMNETVANVAAAGVVPVIAAGNDRDDYGLGSAGSPGTAPDAIAVAAVSNSHVFAPALSVLGGPPSLGAIPLQSAGGAKLPGGWSTLDQTIVDVTSIVGTDGKPVESHLCAPGANPNAPGSTLPAHSLDGAILLANRGFCAFVTKAARAKAAGAIGLILIDNRFGEANPIPIRLQIPAGMISDLDGQRLRAYLSGVGGRAKVRVSSGIQEIQTGRSGVITSFSSAGPTDYGHDLKPDISAPGLDVLSSTPPASTGQTFSVFAGTSMATPHVAGAAALLVERHPTWAAWQVKSALMSTAGPAWADTARTQEAPVWLEGAGLADVSSADDPKIFTNPQSLSFGALDVAGGAQRQSMLLTVSDAGNGSGTWTASLAPQTQTTGVTIDVPGTVEIGPGSDVSVPVTVRVPADGATGDDRGFLVLSNGAVQRRVPYAFTVERSALRDAPVTQLHKLQAGTTSIGQNRVTTYCCPSEPFGPPANYLGGPPMVEDGAEHVYQTDIPDTPLINFGVSVLVSSPNSLIDPWVLNSKNENDVAGYAGTPVNINDLTLDAHVGAAGTQYPRLQRFYVVVDSRQDPFTGTPLKGRYLLNAWANDVTPPAVRMLTTRVSAGRPLLVAQVLDLGAGVDPLSLVIAYNRILLGASAYDPFTGIALFGIPPDAPKLKHGRTNAILEASDYQEAKNINTPGADVYPNTTFRPLKLAVLSGPAVTWILPFAHTCVSKSERLVVTATSTAKSKDVAFRADGRQIGVDRSGPGGVFAVTWHTTGAKKGTHLLEATIVDRAGRSDTAGRRVRVCG
jgi:minor extracellular serine protease Vpr